jgi:hypothetical protein
LCANEGSAATSDGQKIINSGWLFIVGGFAQEARSCFDLAFFFYGSRASRATRRTYAVHCPSLFIFSFSR